MTEEFKVKINFDQTGIRDDIIELLSNNLKEDLDRDSLKITLKESLAIVAKGTPLQKGPANDLLTCILRTLSLVGEEYKEEEEDAEESSGSQDLGTDPTMTQVMGGKHPKEQLADKKNQRGNCADTTQEEDATDLRIAGSTTPASARSSGNGAASLTALKAVMESVITSTPMHVAALSRIKLALGRIVGSST